MNHFIVPCLHVDKNHSILKSMPVDTIHVYPHQDILDVESAEFVGNSIQTIAQYGYRDTFPNICNTLTCCGETINLGKSIFAVLEENKELYLLTFEFKSGEMCCPSGIYRIIYHMFHCYKISGNMKAYYKKIGLENLTYEKICASLNIYENDLVCMGQSHEI